MTERFLAGYRLLNHLADGGSSRCWRAQDKQGRIYILKQFCPRALSPHLEELPGGIMRLTSDLPALRQRFRAAIAMFRREAVVAREIRALYQEQSGNDYFYAAPLVELAHRDGDELQYGAFLLYDTTGGETLSDLLARRALHLDREQGVLTALAWTRRILEAVGQMHNHQNAAGQDAPWLHLDLRPANIYCTRMELDHDEGQRVFRLLDLGSAYPLGDGPEEHSLRQAALLSSTQEYAAPEVLQLLYDPEAPVCLTPAADLYAVGAILFRMLTGHIYDCDPLPPSSPALDAIPLSARHVLTEELLRPVLEGTPEQRPTLDAFTNILARLRQIILHEGVCREVLFSSARLFADHLREQPEPALLPHWTFEGQVFDTLADLLSQIPDQPLFLAGSGMQGKTFSLLHAMVSMTRTPGGPVPLYVPLAAFRDAGERKPRFLQDYLLTRYAGKSDGGDLAAELEFCFKAGSFLLLADGLNEAAVDPAFPDLIAELRRFSTLPGLRMVISAQQDMRGTNFPDGHFALAQPEVLPRERVQAYLADHAIAYPEANPSLCQLLGFPMLLKMYACSAASFGWSAPRVGRPRTYPNPRSAAEIVINYREHVLAKLYDPRNPDTFAQTALLVREFLPYLAFRLCSDEHWHSFSHKMLQSELNRFFYDLQQSTGTGIWSDYDYPDLTFGQPATAALNEDYQQLFAVDNHLFSNQIHTKLEQSLRLMQETGLAETEAEARALLGSTLPLQLQSVSGSALAAAARRTVAVGKILSASGLMVQDEKQNWCFTHDSLRLIFCADHLARFILHNQDPAQMKLQLGRYILPRSICQHIGALCGIDMIRRALALLRGRFDPINGDSLSDYGYEGLTLSAAGLDKPDFMFLNLICSLYVQLSVPVPLSPPELDALLEGEDDSALGPAPDLSLEKLKISLLASALTNNHLSLLDPDTTDGASTFVQCFPEVIGIAYGSYALTAANLVETLLQTTGSLAGEDLSRLDLSSARLRTAVLSNGTKGTVLDGSYLNPEQLRGLDFSDFDPIRHRPFLLHNHSGRFLYLSYGNRLRCFDLWREREVTGFSEPPEFSAPIVRFWLADRHPVLTVVLRDSSVHLLDAFSGHWLGSLFPPADAPGLQTVECACLLGDTLYIQAKIGQHSALLLYSWTPGDPPQVAIRQILERHQLTDKDRFLNGIMSRPGFRLERDLHVVRYFECAEEGHHRMPVGMPGSFPHAAAYSADGKQLSIFGSNGIQVWDTAIGEQSHHLPARHRLVLFRLHTDGSLQAHCGMDEVRAMPDGFPLPGARSIPPFAQNSGDGFFLSKPNRQPFTLLRDGTGELPTPKGTVCAFLEEDKRYLLAYSDQILHLYVQGQTALDIKPLQQVCLPPESGNLPDPLARPRQAALERVFPPRFSLCRLDSAFYLSRSTNTKTEVFAVSAPEVPLLTLDGKHNAVRLFPLDHILLLSTETFTLELDPADGTILARYEEFFLSDLVGNTLLYYGPKPAFLLFRQRHPNCRTFLRPPLEQEFLDLRGVSMQGVLPPLSSYEQKTLHDFGAILSKEEL